MPTLKCGHVILNVKGCCVKTLKIKKPWHELVMSMDVNDITNSYYGSCNLTANYLNDYSEKAITGFADDFIEPLSKDDLFFDEFELSEVTANPDIILQYAANMFVSYLYYLGLGNNHEKLLVHSNWYGKGGDKLVILKAGECYYVVNTTEKPENAFCDVVDSFDADGLSFEIVAVIGGE